MCMCPMCLSQMMIVPCVYVFTTCYFVTLCSCSFLQIHPPASACLNCRSWLEYNMAWTSSLSWAAQSSLKDCPSWSKAYLFYISRSILLCTVICNDLDVGLACQEYLQTVRPFSVTSSASHASYPVLLLFLIAYLPVHQDSSCVCSSTWYCL